MSTQQLVIQSTVNYAKVLIELAVEQLLTHRLHYLWVYSILTIHSEITKFTVWFTSGAQQSKAQSLTVRLEKMNSINQTQTTGGEFFISEDANEQLTTNINYYDYLKPMQVGTKFYVTFGLVNGQPPLNANGSRMSLWNTNGTFAPLLPTNAVVRVNASR